MPRIPYVCDECSTTRKKFYTATKKIENSIKCECGGDMARKLSFPSQKSKIIVDNGVQARAVELDRDIVEIIEDRESSQFRRRGDSVLDNLK